ncbi:MAG: hypothetical protein Q9196_003001 [Gyalolechia fulgens]
MISWQPYVILSAARMNNNILMIAKPVVGFERLVVNKQKMDSDHLSKDLENGSAPWLNVPLVPVVGIEHPCLITDIGRAIDTLGGPEATSKPIASFNTKTSNVLLKITVPKRTGRKRKRGGDGEFLESSQPPSSKPSLLSDPDDAQALLQSMRDNADQYCIEAVGSVQRTHRFRHPRLKDFKFDMSKGVQEKNDLPPPPQWTRHVIPLNYSYCRIPKIKNHLASTDLTTLDGRQTIGRNKLFMLTLDAPSVPAAPSTSLPPESSLAPPLRNLVAAMRQIFIHRPVCTRRVVQNTVPADIWSAAGPNSIKHLWQYIGFLWISGPWRDTICAFGVDPRKDKTMRRYQTMVFQVDSDSKEPNIDRSKAKSRIDRNLAAKMEVRDGHLFDGRTVRLDGKVWQICDVLDPLLKSLIDTDRLRDNCDIVSDGWYTNGTWAKIKVIMKAKVSAILAGEIDHEQLENELLKLKQKVPDILTEENRAEAIFEKGSASARMVKWADTIRTSVTRPGGKKIAWGSETAKQPPRVLASAAKKTAVPGRAKESGWRGGRSRKKSGGARADKLEGQNGAVNEQKMIDPRLRGAAGDLADEEREAALRGFEDDLEDSDKEGSSMESSGTESLDEESDEDEPDTDDVNTSEDEESTSSE